MANAVIFSAVSQQRSDIMNTLNFKAMIKMLITLAIIDSAIIFFFLKVQPYYHAKRIAKASRKTKKKFDEVFKEFEMPANSKGVNTSTYCGN